MKQVKKNLVCIAVAAFAVCTAFTTKMAMPLSWRFTGNECDWTQRVNPGYYVQEWLTCSPGVDHFCKIVAISSGGKPVIPNPSVLYSCLVNNHESLPEPVSGI